MPVFGAGLATVTMGILLVVLVYGLHLAVLVSELSVGRSSLPGRLWFSDGSQIDLQINISKNRKIFNINSAPSFYVLSSIFRL